jgi:purine-binding chemotaxis protein CheW
MTMTTEANNDAQIVDEERAGKYLTFDLGAEEYGIPIIKVKEINGMMPITKVPQTDDYMKGVINLRGKVIPVVDLRLKFGMEAIEYTERTCIIVVEVQGEKGTISIGLVVDGVSEVNSIKEEEIEAPPAFGTALSTEYILGMAKKDDGVKILLDINRVLRTQELARMCDAGGGGES